MEPQRLTDTPPADTSRRIYIYLFQKQTNAPFYPGWVNRNSLTLCDIHLALDKWVAIEIDCTNIADHL